MTKLQDWQDAQTWLKAQPTQTRVWFANRNALRVFPLVGFENQPSFDVVCLLMLRCIVTAYGHIKNPENHRRNDRMNYDALREISDSTHSDIMAVEHAREAADSTLSGNSSFSSAFGLEHAIRAAREADEVSGLNSSSENIANDEICNAAVQVLRAAYVDTHRPGNEEGIWHEHEMPSSIAKGMEQLNLRWHLEPRSWSFWTSWYQGFLDGKHLNWELQRRMALIKDQVWEAGPKAVAEEIEKVSAKFYLEERINELEADLRRATFDRHGIGGNRQPESLDAAPVTKELVILWGPLEELKEEIVKDDPDPDRLQTIVDALIYALKTGIAWGLRKSDLIVDTAIKWAVPAGGTGYFALNPDKLEAVIEAVKTLLNTL
ncbi:hypothetical protein IWQ52_001271 [Labrenzia sp. EL_159]|nr:hypothetical protein [Labrenzia sp. EL_162]MBG6193769.1 hypothetical protein [Labrenzia sp. EL_159]